MCQTTTRLCQRIVSFQLLRSETLAAALRAVVWLATGHCKLTLILASGHKWVVFALALFERIVVPPFCGKRAAAVSSALLWSRYSQPGFNPSVAPPHTTTLSKTTQVVIVVVTVVQVEAGIRLELDECCSGGLFYFVKRSF